MKTAKINGNEINSRYQLHEKLADSLSFPEWYGRNLDALHDLLTETAEDTTVIITDFSTLEKKLGRYAQLFRKVISDAAEENPKIHIEIE